jgi:hypothetical protein
MHVNSFIISVKLYKSTTLYLTFLAKSVGFLFTLDYRIDLLSYFSIGQPFTKSNKFLYDQTVETNRKICKSGGKPGRVG